MLLNKADLCVDPQGCKTQVEAIAAGTPVHFCCARNPQQIDFLFGYLQPGRTLAMLGSSGVGKSTILNSLLGEQRQKVGEINEAIGRGRHTTTHRELFLMPQGGILMDNPGMRELHLWGEEDDLAEPFSEIEALAGGCRFNDCRHRSEPGCAVLAAVAAGTLSSDRLASYQKLKDELAQLQRRR